METRHLPISERLARAVRDFPDHDALRTAGSSLSYREFGERVADVAKRLGVQTAPGEFIGIKADRGVGAIVAMAGALTAGRPFVFVDARDSATSNSDKIGRLGVRLLAGSSPEADGVELAEVPAAWRHGRGATPPDVIAGDDVAYAIHTSGSTGEPKCVLVAAGPLAPVIHDHVVRLALGPGSRTLQFARLTFDGCVTEILWTLVSGACLVVLDEASLAPGPVLRDTLERFGITHLKTTPFALTATEPSGAMRLAHVINGGGACRPAVLARWAEVAAFHNAYGLTETTVCNLLSAPLNPADWRDSVPLGDLVGDCGYLIRELDDGGRPDPAARRGELVITGASVAVGYLTDDGVRPFGRADGDRAYPTGDVVELRAGQLHFVQRLDRQVKVRGFRLDPGEIERAVCGLESVQDAVVVAEAHDGTDTADQDALICYYLGDADPRSVRRHLEGTLDPYKVPSVLERVEAFPYTPNGKVDHDALRATRGSRAAVAEDATAGDRILHLARTLTGVGDAGLDDNFFEIGGDSASAVVLVARIKELGWVDVGVRDVLRAESLRVLADGLHERSV